VPGDTLRFGPAVGSQGEEVRVAHETPSNGKGLDNGRSLRSVPRPGRARQAAKADTRQRLLAAAWAILDEHGEAALTTGRVAEAAGIAQSSFYVHFAGIDDLMATLSELVTARLRDATSAARLRSADAPTDRDRLRETFRIPLEAISAHPALFRVLRRAALDPSSPLHEAALGLQQAERRRLMDDMPNFGLLNPAVSERQMSMLADGIIAVSASLTAGHLDGRYPDIEEVVDALVLFAKGYLRSPRRAGGQAGPTDHVVRNPPSTGSVTPLT
jgi:AcrR family transcriptional regulator